jgi:hypothetical protein
MSKQIANKSQTSHKPAYKSILFNGLNFIGLILLMASCSKNMETKPPEESSQKETTFSFQYNRSTKIVEFPNFSDYRNYLASEYKQSIFDSLSLFQFQSLYDEVKSGSAEELTPFNTTDVPKEKYWYQNEDVINFSRILNVDGIFGIGAYCFKVDNPGKFIYVARKNSIVGNKKMYNDLKNEIETNGEIYKFSTDYDVLDMLEEVGLPTGDAQTQSILCWHRGAAKSINFQPAVYFLDETWPASVISFSANDLNLPSSNSRVSVKLEYLRLGVFFQLVLKGKYDREDGSVDINGDPIFGGSSPWGTGEGNWNITFTEKHQGKCRKDNEVFNSGTIYPPLNNENKTRRVFWESDNGLHKYKLTATLNLYCKRAWRGLETERYHAVSINEFFTNSTPGMVNSTQIYNFQPFEISDNY